MYQKYGRLMVVFAVGALLAAAGDNYTWTNARGDGDWTQPGNFIEGAVQTPTGEETVATVCPGADDEVFLPVNAAVTLEYDGFSVSAEGGWYKTYIPFTCGFTAIFEGGMVVSAGDKLTENGNAVELTPDMPMFDDIYKFKSACIAIYPMYRGLARLVGMNMLPVPADIPDEFEALKANWDKFDFFFMHIKYTDSFGEDGNFAKKCAIIEQVDTLLTKVLDLDPDVLVVTGDHSTPSLMKSHSWHPVPYLLYSKKCRLKAGQNNFGETACAAGTLGTFPSVENMAQMMAYAGRLTKFGA